jgi:hypothetical protein
VWIEPDVSELLLDEVGTLSNVNVSCFDANPDDKALDVA